jgi:hypothetical protein
MKKKSSKIDVKKCLEDTLKTDFWFKKVLKCKVNIKKIKPTPKSITHKKPTYTSKSFNIDNIPIRIR